MLKDVVVLRKLPIKQVMNLMQLQYVHLLCFRNEIWIEGVLTARENLALICIEVNGVL